MLHVTQTSGGKSQFTGQSRVLPTGFPADAIRPLSESGVFYARGKPSWARIVRRAAMYRFYGFSIQEWTAKRRPDGLLTLADVAPRSQMTIERWDMLTDGSIQGVVQRKHAVCVSGGGCRRVVVHQKPECCYRRAARDSPVKRQHSTLVCARRRGWRGHPGRAPKGLRKRRDGSA